MGSKVREYREKMNMTQEELAKKSGVSRVTISSIESGRAENTTSKTLLRIATALNATVDEIFFGQVV